MLASGCPCWSGATAGQDGISVKSVGTDPPNFTAWAQNEGLVIEATSEYWHGVSTVRRLTVRPIVEDSTRVGVTVSLRDLLDPRLRNSTYKGPSRHP
jgi:hypothetical protein